MIFEIAGSRLVAPYLGSSTYVWTSIIGVILGALSLGYWLGGIKADKNPTSVLLAKILLLSGILILFSYSFSELILSLLHTTNSYVFSSFISSLILFAPASVLLGMVSPLIVRLKMNDVAHSGQTVGNLYAISTLGSIVGTFLAGYLLIPLFGTSKILIGLSIIMAVLATYTDISAFQFKLTLRNLLLVFLIILFTLFAFFRNGQKVVAEFDTIYSHIQIYKTTDFTKTANQERNREIQVLKMNAVAHSGMFTDDNYELVFPYTKYYKLAEYFKPDFDKTLMLGGGAFSFPKYFLKNYSSASIDVVEIDPMVTELAFKYFGLKKNPRLNIFEQDGRVFIDKTSDTYDVVYGDVFSSYLSIPFHLTTLEATQSVARILNDDGVYIVNVIGSLEGTSSDFTQAYLATLDIVFPNVYAFTTEANNSTNFQNIILVATKSPLQRDLLSDNQELADLLANNWPRSDTQSQTILTDDFAPVEYYMKSALSNRGS